jgi:hypothetical protein
VEVVELVSKITTPKTPKTFATFHCLVNDYFQSYENSTPSEFIGVISDRLKFIETFRPAPSDFAIEELQNECVGPLTPVLRPIAPGPDWPPIKGVVTALARERLRKQGRKANFSKSSWSEFLKEADRDKELVEGKPGRPQSLDENIKAERELKALTTKMVNTIIETHGGDRRRALEVLKAAFGNKAETLRSEGERLRKLWQDLREKDTE